MVIPTPTVLPDSTLAPWQVIQKFSPTSFHGVSGLAGLGECSPNPADSDYCGPAQSATVLDEAGIRWSDYLNSLTKQGFDLAKLWVIKPGTTQTPGGITMQPPGINLQTPGLNLTGSPGGVGMGTMVMVGGIALLMVMMMTQRNRG